MRRLVTLLTICGLGLSGCSGARDSRANPANWFGGGSAATETSATNPLIPEKTDSIFQAKSDAELYEGTPIYAVERIAVERSTGGAIITATGISLRQGAFDVRLWPENNGRPQGGVLSYTLRAVQRSDTQQGPSQTRRVSAGQFVSAQTLDRVREIRVQGRTNTATSAR